MHTHTHTHDRGVLARVYYYCWRTVSGRSAVNARDVYARAFNTSRPVNVGTRREAQHKLPNVLILLRV